MNSTQYTNWLDYINLYHYYPNPYFWGVLLFFLVPIVLWFIGSAFIRRPEWSSKFLAFIAGSDNRLSLSRLQAFAWTLVIFGSFVAAMAIHTKIMPTDKDTANEYKKKAESTASVAAARKVVMEQAEKDRIGAETDFLAANKNASDKQALTDAYNSSNVTTEEAKKAQEETTDANVIAKSKESIKNLSMQTAALAVEQFENEQKTAEKAAMIASSFNWVDIPAALLALAGIAIGSGIFSSLISALNDEEKTACVNAIEKIDKTFFNERNADGKKKNYPDTVDTQSDNILKIIGKDMGKAGKVRFGKGKIYSTYAPILLWKSDGTEIIVDVPANSSYNTLVVDTPNGKLSYELKDITVAELDQKRAPIDVKLEQAKAEVANLERAKQEEQNTLTAVTANFQNLQNSGADAAKQKEAQDVVERVKKQVEAKTTSLEQAQKSAKDLQTERNKLRLGDVSNLNLGIPSYYYEFSDLFRDDKNPNNMDLMKFQMFGWTVVAIIIYSWLFLNDLRNNIESLPLVPLSIVILTGLSQAGYLAGKGVAGVQPNKPAGS